MKVSSSFFLAYGLLVLMISEVRADQKNISFDGVDVFAGIYNKSLRFTVKNNSERDYMIVDDFCFDAKLHTVILSLPSLVERDDHFSNGISRKQGRMMRLKSHSERSCEIGYIESPKKNSGEENKGLVIWYTNLFIGDFNDSFSSQEFSGVIPASLSSHGLDTESLKSSIDVSTLDAYRMRKTLGLIE